MLPLSNSAVALLMAVAAIGFKFLPDPVTDMMFTVICLGVYIIVERDNKND